VPIQKGQQLFIQQSLSFEEAQNQQAQGQNPQVQYQRHLYQHQENRQQQKQQQELPRQAAELNAFEELIDDYNQNGGSNHS